MEKTKVEILDDVYQGNLKKGDIGFIEGFVQGGDGRPYAVISSNGMLDLVMTYNLKVLN